MAAHAVPYPARTTFSRPWLTFGTRLLLAVLAMWVLHLAQNRYASFYEHYSATFHMEWWRWFAWIGTSVAAGLLFGIAAWFPFTKVRFAWSRLLLAAVALAPVAQFWVMWG